MERVDDILNLDFEGRSPDDSDITGIRILLRQLFLQSGIDISQMANEIVSQNYIGSVLHQIYDDYDDDDDDDDDDEEGDADDPVFGIITIINISDKKELKFVDELHSFVTQKCKENCSKNTAIRFEEILSDQKEKIGFLINERILSTPQVALPNFESLWKDLDRANKKNMKYNFSKYLIIARASVSNSRKCVNTGTREFVNPEDEIFCKDSLIEMSSAEQLMTEEREPIRMIMLVEADKMPLIMKEVKDLCEQFN